MLSGTSKLIVILKAEVRLAFSLLSLSNEEFGIQLVLGFCIVEE